MPRSAWANHLYFSLARKTPWVLAKACEGLTALNYDIIKGLRGSEQTWNGYLQTFEICWNGKHDQSVLSNQFWLRNWRLWFSIWNVATTSASSRFVWILQSLGFQSCVMWQVLIAARDRQLPNAIVCCLPNTLRFLIQYQMSQLSI